jgi:hypothetical protein
MKALCIFQGNEERVYGLRKFPFSPEALSLLKFLPDELKKLGRIIGR